MRLILVILLFFAGTVLSKYYEKRRFDRSVYDGFETPHVRKTLIKKRWTFTDHETHFKAYKDKKENDCYIENIGTTNTAAKGKSNNEIEQQKSTSKILYAPHEFLTKLEAWRIAGGRIVNFCKGRKIILLQSSVPILEQTIDPFLNIIPLDENDIASRRVADVVLTPLISRAKRQVALEEKQKLNENFKKIRSRRQVQHSPGKFRGQTQSQYLSIGNNDQKEGKAEAEATQQSSRAVVSGSYGMGQAQSMSLGGIGCEECPKYATEGAPDRYVQHPSITGIRRPGDATIPERGTTYTDRVPGSATRGHISYPTNIPGTVTSDGVLYPGGVVTSTIGGVPVYSGGVPRTQTGGTTTGGRVAYSGGVPGTTTGGVTVYPGDIPGTRTGGATIYPGGAVYPGGAIYPNGVPGTTTGGGEVYPGNVPGSTTGGRVVYPGGTSGTITGIGTAYPGGLPGTTTGGSTTYPGGLPGTTTGGGTTYPGGLPGTTTGGGTTYPRGLPGTTTGGGTTYPGGLPGTTTGGGTVYSGSIPGTSTGDATIYPSGIPGITTGGGVVYPGGVPDATTGGGVVYPGGTPDTTTYPGGIPSTTTGDGTVYPGGVPGVTTSGGAVYPGGVPGTTTSGRVVYPGGTTSGDAVYPGRISGTTTATGVVYPGGIPSTATVGSTTYPGGIPGTTTSGGTIYPGAIPGTTTDGRVIYRGSTPGTTTGGGAVYPGGVPGSTTGGGTVYSGGMPGTTGGGGAVYTGAVPGSTTTTRIAYPGGLPGTTTGGGAVYPGGVPGSTTGGGTVYPGGMPGTTGGSTVYPGGIPGTTTSGGTVYSGGIPGTTTGGSTVYPGGIPVTTTGGGTVYPGGTLADTTRSQIVTESKATTDTKIYPNGQIPTTQFFNGGRYPSDGSSDTREGAYRNIAPPGTIGGTTGGVPGQSREIVHYSGKVIPDRAPDTGAISGTPVTYPSGGTYPGGIVPGVTGPFVTGEQPGISYPHGVMRYPDNSMAQIPDSSRYPDNRAITSRYPVQGQYPGAATWHDREPPTTGVTGESVLRGVNGQMIDQYRNKEQDIKQQYPGLQQYLPSIGPVANTGQVSQYYQQPGGFLTAEDENSNSQASSSVKQTDSGTEASASAQGQFGQGTAQSEVTGTYSGSGSFSAQAGSTDINKSVQTEINGGKEGATSNAQGVGGHGKSQAQVLLNSDSGATTTNAQSSGKNHGTNSQVQASSKGGMADAQANGEGSTSSQAQIGFQPYLKTNEKLEKQSKPFRGGGTASAQSGAYTGQSQSQLEGSFQYGITYTGAAQAGSGSGAAASRKPFNFSLTDNEPFKSLKPPYIPEVVNNNNNNNSEAANASSDRDDEYNQDKLQQGLQTSSSSQRRVFTKPTDENSQSETGKPNQSVERSQTDDTVYDYEEEYDGEDYDASALQSSKIAKIYGAEQNDSFRQSQTIHVATGNQYDVHVKQDTNTAQVGDMLQPGQSLSGYIIPHGFRGRVTSTAGKETIANGDGKSQSQTVSLVPKVPNVIHESKSPISEIRSLKTNKERQRNNFPQIQKHQIPKEYSKHTTSVPTNPNYYTITNSVAGKMDDKNSPRKYEHRYYTKSSTCGYFTFSCNVVYGSNGRTKICKPKMPTNPDGTPMKC